MSAAPTPRVVSLVPAPAPVLLPPSLLAAPSVLAKANRWKWVGAISVGCILRRPAIIS